MLDLRSTRQDLLICFAADNRSHSVLHVRDARPVSRRTGSLVPRDQEPDARSEQATRVFLVVLRIHSYTYEDDCSSQTYDEMNSFKYSMAYVPAAWGVASLD